VIREQLFQCGINMLVPYLPGRISQSAPFAPNVMEGHLNGPSVHDIGPVLNSGLLTLDRSHCPRRMQCLSPHADRLAERLEGADGGVRSDQRERVLTHKMPH
jgi:hypothetical protein